MLARVAVLALLAVRATAADYTLYHRYISDTAEFVPRGVVSIDGGKASYTPKESAKSTSAEGDWYQVALEVDGNSLVTSTPACFADSDARLTVFLTADKPSSIDYKPSSVPTSGNCTNSASSALPSSDITVIVQSPHVVRSPPLAEPVVVDQTGQTVTPPPEKSFIQKYWVAIVGAMLFMATQMGPPDDQQRRRGGGGSGARE